MNKYAIIKDGVVINVIEYAEQPSTPPDGFEDGHIAIQADAVSVGWHYANGQFTDQNPPTNNEAPTSTTPAITLTDMILANPTELAKLKTALGIA
jgi:hypothetical protein